MGVSFFRVWGGSLKFLGQSLGKRRQMRGGGTDQLQLSPSPSLQQGVPQEKLVPFARKLNTPLAQETRERRLWQVLDEVMAWLHLTLQDAIREVMML